MRSLSCALVAAVACVLLPGLTSAAPQENGANPRVDMVIAHRGTVVMELYPRDAPKTVAHFLNLVKKHFYDGIKVHRYVPGFVVQMGDPGTKGLDPAQFDEHAIGTHGSGTTVPLEAKLPHDLYTVGLARSSDPNSGDSQFYINLKANHQLDGSYTVFGKVVKGQNVADALRVGDVITSMRVEKPAEAKGRKK